MFGSDTEVAVGIYLVTYIIEAAGMQVCRVVAKEVEGFGYTAVEINRLGFSRKVKVGRKDKGWLDRGRLVGKVEVWVCYIENDTQVGK